MSKLWLFIIFLILGGLIYTGVIEIKFNFTADSINPPNFAKNLIKEKTTYEKGRAFSVGLKRKTELFVVRNREKRLVLSLVYVKADATRLEELIDSEINAEGLLPQAEQLVNSLELVRSNAQKAPVEVVAEQKQDSREAFAKAQQALGRLQAQHEEYSKINEEFGRLTEALEQQIGELGLEGIAPDSDEELEVGEEEIEFIDLEESSVDQ